MIFSTEFYLSMSIVNAFMSIVGPIVGVRYKGLGLVPNTMGITCVLFSLLLDLCYMVIESMNAGNFSIPLFS